MTVVVTGVAGFIGAAVAERLLRGGETVLGIDSLNDYYDVNLKIARVRRLKEQTSFSFLHDTVSGAVNRDIVREAVAGHPVIHLAAQAGVRYSLVDPEAYVQSNLVDFWAILELARREGSKHFVYASSSSVYGTGRNLPLREDSPVNHPVSLYAATKRSNELLAESYSHLYDLPATGLRFFSVYGPWGRPDMAVFDFTRRILSGEEITVFGRGELSRDFTFIDDIVSGVVASLAHVPQRSSARGAECNETGSPHQILNLGNETPVSVYDLVARLEQVTGKRAIRRYLPVQPGDVDHTLASIELAKRTIGYEPKTSFDDGLARFVRWYRRYYRV